MDSSVPQYRHAQFMTVMQAILGPVRDLMTSGIGIVLGIFTFGGVILPAAAAGQSACATQERTALYAAVGPKLVQYDLDLNAATLTEHGSVTLPENVQDATMLETTRSPEYLYAAWSEGGPVNGIIPPGSHRHHGISAFRIDSTSGALLPNGVPTMLPSRPIFITSDRSGAHVLTAHNSPSAVNVYTVMSNGTLGTEVPQGANLDFGVYAHQVRADPSGKTIFLVTRGIAPTDTSPEQPGAIKVYSYKNGVLGNLLSIAPGGGFGYQVRDLDFDPSGKWVFAALERQNQIQVYRRMPDGMLSSQPLFIQSTLMKTTRNGTGQASSIHVHPSGKSVYVANRSLNGGGENTIAVFSINRQTGEPKLIQSVDTRGFEARTFALDPCGKILAVGNQQAGAIRDSAGTTTTIPGSIALFRIKADGTLEFARKYDIETTPKQSLFWVGMAPLL